jgi:hypothetical protein
MGRLPRLSSAGRSNFSQTKRNSSEEIAPFPSYNIIARFDIYVWKKEALLKPPKEEPWMSCL